MLKKSDGSLLYSHIAAWYYYRYLAGIPNNLAQYIEVMGDCADYRNHI